MAEYEINNQTGLLLRYFKVTDEYIDFLTNRITELNYNNKFLKNDNLLLKSKIEILNLKIDMQEKKYKNPIYFKYK